MASSSEMGHVRGEMSPVSDTPAVKKKSSFSGNAVSGLVPSVDGVATAELAGKSGAESRPVPSVFVSDIPVGNVAAARTEPKVISHDLITIIPQPERLREHAHVRDIPENETPREAAIEQWASVVNAAESVFGHFASIEDVRIRLQQIETEVRLSQSGVLTQDELTHLDAANIRKFYHSLASVDSPIGLEAKRYGMVTDSLTEQEIRDEIAEGRKVIILDQYLSGAHRPRHVDMVEDQIIDAFGGEEVILEPERAYLSFIFEKRKDKHSVDGQISEETVFERRDSEIVDTDSSTGQGKHTRTDVIEQEVPSQQAESNGMSEQLRRSIRKYQYGCAIRAVESAFGVRATAEETDHRLDQYVFALEYFNRLTQSATDNMSLHKAVRETNALDLANLSMYYHLLSGNDTELGREMSRYTMRTKSLQVSDLQQIIGEGKKVIVQVIRQGQDGKEGHARHLGMDEHGFIDLVENTYVTLNPDFEYFSFVFEERAQGDAKPSGSAFDGGDGVKKTDKDEEASTVKPGDHGEGTPPGSEPPTDALSEGEPRGVRDLLNRVRRPFTVTHDDAMRAGDLLGSFVNAITQRELQTLDVPPPDQFAGLTENSYTELAIFDIGDGIHARVEWQEGMISGIPGVSRVVVYEDIPGSQEENEICRYFRVGDGPAMRIDLDQLHNPTIETTGEISDNEARFRKLEQDERNSGFVGVAEMADLEDILGRAPRAEMAVAVEILPDQESSESVKPLDRLRRQTDASALSEEEARLAAERFSTVLSEKLTESDKTRVNQFGTLTQRRVYLRNRIDGTIGLIQELKDVTMDKPVFSWLRFREPGVAGVEGPRICDYIMSDEVSPVRWDYDTETGRRVSEMTGDIEQEQLIAIITQEVSAGFNGSFIGLEETRDLRTYLAEFEPIAEDER